MVEANGMPLYAGPKRTSNSGNALDVSESEMVAAYAVDKLARIGPVLRRPALKKYGEILS